MLDELAAVRTASSSHLQLSLDVIIPMGRPIGIQPAHEVSIAAILPEVLKLSLRRPEQAAYGATRCGPECYATGRLQALVCKPHRPLLALQRPLLCIATEIRTSFADDSARSCCLSRCQACMRLNFDTHGCGVLQCAADCACASCLTFAKRSLPLKFMMPRYDRCLVAQ